MTPDPVMVEVDRGIQLGRAGEREAARLVFMQLWEALGEKGEPLHRCAVSHSMADVQDEPDEELVWDLRALEAADEVTEESVEMAGMAGGVRSLYPSLHLNLSDVYRRLGRVDLARDHVEKGRVALEEVDDGEGGYWKMIRQALDRVSAEVGR